jgi:hypothetical protein
MRHRLAEADKGRAPIQTLSRQVALEWVQRAICNSGGGMLKLVRDRATLNAYKVVVEWWLKVAWEGE